jgi:hypothetical protein
MTVIKIYVIYVNGRVHIGSIKLSYRVVYFLLARRVKQQIPTGTERFDAFLRLLDFSIPVLCRVNMLPSKKEGLIEIRETR